MCPYKKRHQRALPSLSLPLSPSFSPSLIPFFSPCLLLSLLLCEYIVRRPPSASQETHLPEPHCASTLISDFATPERLENKHLWFKTPSLRCLVSLSRVDGHILLGSQNQEVNALCPQLCSYNSAHCNVRANISSHSVLVPRGSPSLLPPHASSSCP